MVEKIQKKTKRKCLTLIPFPDEAVPVRGEGGLGGGLRVSVQRPLPRPAPEEVP